MTETPAPVVRRLSRWRILQLTLLSGAVALGAAWWLVVRPTTTDSDTAPGADAPTTAALGRPAPHITFAGLDGEAIDVAALRGHVVVLNFWASTCVPCNKEMPLLEAAAQARPEVRFVGVSVAESVAAGTSMVRRTGVTFPQGRDPAGDGLGAFGGIALPHTVVIDRTGTVVALANRAIRDRADLDDLIGRAG